MSLKTKTKHELRTNNHEKVVNDETRVFTEADFPVGTVSHQGDIILVRIAKMPKTAKPRSSQQLADGNTMGSRHIAKGQVFECKPAEVAKLISEVCPKAKVQEYLIGPVFLGCNLEHEEHGNQVFPEGSVIATVFQRTLESEEREARVKD